MAKKKATNNGTSSDNQGESISGYFRKVFAGNPHWLNSRSNDAILEQWLADHPGETSVPNKVKQNLSNIKSVLRKKGRKKRGRPRKDSLPGQAASASAETPRKPVKGLDALEEQIDDCLSYAKHLDREGLADVINLLRRARNGVVWKMGEKSIS